MISEYFIKLEGEKMFNTIAVLYVLVSIYFGWKFLSGRIPLLERKGIGYIIAKFFLAWGIGIIFGAFFIIAAICKILFSQARR